MKIVRNKGGDNLPLSLIIYRQNVDSWRICTISTVPKFGTTQFYFSRGCLVHEIKRGFYFSTEIRYFFVFLVHEM